VKSIEYQRIFSKDFVKLLSTSFATFLKDSKGLTYILENGRIFSQAT
jgi:hypothetical protein